MGLVGPLRSAQAAPVSATLSTPAANGRSMNDIDLARHMD
jgi:hypothetical protein